jgi:hypothetical protein
MKPTTPQTRPYMPLFEAVAAAAGLASKGSVKVSVSSKHDTPNMQGGKINLPTAIVEMLREEDRGPIIAVQTFVHELQHAVDYFDPSCASRSREEWETRARLAEHFLSDDQIIALVQAHVLSEAS